MSSATGSKSYIALVKQTPATPKVIPTTPVMQKVNFLDESLARIPITKVSDHIRSDRRTSDLINIGYNVEGGYNFEFQFENSLTDELLAAALCVSAWSTPQTNIDIEGGSFTVSGAVLDLTGATVKPTVIDGQNFRITNTANNGANDGIYALTETATNVYTVVPAPAANETFGAGVLLNGSMIRDGSFYQPFFIERGHVDVGQYFKYLGMVVNMLTLSFPDQAEATGRYDFIGLGFQLDQAIESGATYTGQSQTPIFSSSMAKTVFIDGVAQASCHIKEITDLQINNNITRKTGIGVFGACESKLHRLNIDCKLTAYFEDEELFNMVVDGTAFSLSWAVIDPNGHGYAITLPRCKLTEDPINVTGGDSDIMDNATVVALYDSVTDCMIQIDKF